jgi:hypothetical protein
MNKFNLLEMCESFNRQRIILCFNGPTSRGLDEEVGKALRAYLLMHQASGTLATSVFSVYVEMTQNIRHYTARKHWSETQTTATVVVARDPQERYVIYAGNLIEHADVEALLARVGQLGQLDKAQLKSLYKEQLHRPREADGQSGAGLGLIDIARTSSMPLQASAQPMADGLSYFTLRAVI